MGRLFGTDGVRGVANRELTAELALALGAAAARRLTASRRGRRRVAVIGRDPRASGEMLEAAVIAGLTSEGVDALRVGVLPTPAVAYLTRAYDADPPARSPGARQAACRCGAQRERQLGGQLAIGDPANTIGAE